MVGDQSSNSSGCVATGKLAVQQADSTLAGSGIRLASLVDRIPTVQQHTFVSVNEVIVLSQAAVRG